jgi:hypothetical protein
MATDQKQTQTQPAETAAPKNRQVNATIPGALFDDLEGYAFGTRRKMSELMKDIVTEWAAQNADEIAKRKV